MQPPGEPRRVAYLYIAPGLALFAVVVLLPLVQSVRLSFYSWDGITAKKWVGLKNYRDVLQDPELRGAFLHAFELVAFYSVIPVCLGLLLASVLAHKRVRGMTVWRTILFLPQIVAPVVVGVSWSWIYGPDGSLNHALGAVGLGFMQHAWLGDFGWALPAVGLVGAWIMYGFCMLLFLAGIQRIPTSLYEAARVDGAGVLREFAHVTLPGLRNELVVAAAITVIAGLRSFDVVYVTTLGGPGDATSVPALEVYKRAFQYGQVGSASAIAVALGVVVFAATLLVVRLGDSRR